MSSFGRAPQVNGDQEKRFHSPYLAGRFAFVCENSQAIARGRGEASLSTNVRDGEGVPRPRNRFARPQAAEVHICRRRKVSTRNYWEMVMR